MPAYVIFDLERRIQEAARKAEIRVREAEERAQEAEEESDKIAQEAEERVQEAEERVQEAEERVQEAEERAQDAEERAQDADYRAQEAEERAQDADYRAQEAEERAQIADGRVQEAEERVQEAEERAQEAEERAQDTDDRAQEAEEMAQEAEERAQDAEERAQDAYDRAQEMAQEAEVRAEAIVQLERSLAESEQQAETHLVRVTEALRECEECLRQLENQWVVRRDEIEFIGRELGRGGWATVEVVIFRNVQVAAKSIHHQILSPYNIELFRREMNMAARIRHPNLVQFIGATVELDEEMMILTELMPTSLRRELQREYMPPSEVISIGLDVVRALNYLHQMQPDSIIHRDVSSANVLLEYKSRNRWKAKLSDYGSVNLLNQLQTENPGNPVYSAPEANNPSQQSPKMDIYSFGALLVEMLTGVLPAREERRRLLGRIHHEQLLDLIGRCLRERREERPNASDIIIEFES